MSNTFKKKDSKREYLQIRLTAHDKQMILEKSALLEVSMADFIADCCRRRKVVGYVEPKKSSKKEEG